MRRFITRQNKSQEPVILFTQNNKTTHRIVA